MLSHKSAKIDTIGVIVIKTNFI